MDGSPTTLPITYAGALINTEDGSESYNVIERNFVMRGSGTGGRLGHGNEGMGFWFRGPNNYVRGNVAADFDSDEVEAAYGFKYFMHGTCPTCDSLAEIKIPTVPGQDMSEYVTVDGNALPILQFEDNEVYSAAEGLTHWWLSSKDPVPVANPKPSVFKNLRIWHVYNVGIYHYPAARVLFDGLHIFGESGYRVNDPAALACCGRGFHGEDYAATDVRIVNAEIHNMWTGVLPSGAGTGMQIVENSSIRSALWADIGIDRMFSVNGADWLPARRIILNNVRLAGNTTISKEWSSNRDPSILNDIKPTSSSCIRIKATRPITSKCSSASRRRRASPEACLPAGPRGLGSWASSARLTEYGSRHHVAGSVGRFDVGRNHRSDFGRRIQAGRDGDV